MSKTDFVFSSDAVTKANGGDEVLATREIREAPEIRPAGCNSPVPLWSPADLALGRGAIMRKTRSFLLAFGLLLVASPFMTLFSTRAQDPDVAFEQVVGHPRGLPQLPPQGAWGEVINVTPRWLVVQNHSGQQYPIAFEDIGEFLARWPSGVDALGPQSVVEAIGRDVGSNTVEVSHVDVFEGGDRSLVQPTYNNLLTSNAIVTAIDPGFNRFMNGWDYQGQSQLYGWAFPTTMGGSMPPVRLHVVGTVIQRVPLQVSLPGNNFATVVGGGNLQFTMSQVTRGTMAMARKGDYVFMMPQQINPRGVVVSQLVLYKSMPYAAFLGGPR
jgi:hypothetical protein